MSTESDNMLEDNEYPNVPVAAGTSESEMMPFIGLSNGSVATPNTSEPVESRELREIVENLIKLTKPEAD